ncbi:PAS domain S-box protein [Candidatus Bathyarchaeota archaeon]|nr:PAS domain S-box protein [Candidatus Bathyarchaeota archaeon]
MSEGSPEDIYKDFFDNLFEGIAYHQIVLDESGKPADYIFLMANEAFEKLTGLHTEDIVGKRVTEVIPGIQNDPADWIGRYGRVALSMEPVSFEQYAEGLGQLYNVKAYSPKHGYFVTLFENITEKRVKEEELYLKSIISDSANDSIILHHENGDIIYANKRAQEFYGYTEKELLSMNIRDIVKPSQRERVADRASLIKNKGQAVFETDNVDSRGNMLFVEVHSNIVSYKNEDLILSVVRDIGERKRITETEKQYTTRMTALHKHASALAKAEDLDEIQSITYNAIREVLGFERGSLAIVVGDVLRHEYRWNMSAPNSFDIPLSTRSITTRVVSTGITQLVPDVDKDPDYFTNYPDRADRTRSELAVPIKIDEKVEGVLNLESVRIGAFSATDQQLLEIFSEHIASSMLRIKLQEESEKIKEQLIEQRIRAEQQAELNELKTRFISNATHEIRTPLTSIQGYSEIIQSAIESNELDSLTKYFDVIIRNVNRLKVLTDELLDMQKLEEGRIELDIEPINLATYLEDIRQEISPILEKKEQSLVINTARDLTINSDKVRLEQVIINLLNNASRFSPKNSAIEINVEPAQSGVEITITDHGVGIREEDLPKLFKPFPGIKVEDSFQSTGLGLSICKGIVDLLKGSISAQSDGPGKGTKFTIKLPR